MKTIVLLITLCAVTSALSQTTSLPPVPWGPPPEEPEVWVSGAQYPLLIVRHGRTNYVLPPGGNLEQVLPVYGSTPARIWVVTNGGAVATAPLQMPTPTITAEPKPEEWYYHPPSGNGLGPNLSPEVARMWSQNRARRSAIVPTPRYGIPPPKNGAGIVRTPRYGVPAQSSSAIARTPGYGIAPPSGIHAVAPSPTYGLQPEQSRSSYTTGPAVGLPLHQDAIVRGPQHGPPQNGGAVAPGPIRGQRTGIGAIVPAPTVGPRGVGAGTVPAPQVGVPATGTSTVWVPTPKLGAQAGVSATVPAPAFGYVPAGGQNATAPGPEVGPPNENSAVVPTPRYHFK